MLFSWDDDNLDHVSKHSVSAAEAEEIVANARAPFPVELGDDKFLVRGQTSVGRYLQVIIAFKRPEEIPYVSLSSDEWSEVEAKGLTEVIRVIHAMELTPAIKKRLRKRWRR